MILNKSPFNILSHRIWLVAIQIIVVAVLYYAFGKLAFSLSVQHGIVTNVPFFAEGVGLASAILFGIPAAIGVFVGQFVLAITSGVALLPYLGYIVHQCNTCHVWPFFILQTAA